MSSCGGGRGAVGVVAAGQLTGRRRRKACRSANCAPFWDATGRPAWF